MNTNALLYRVEQQLKKYRPKSGWAGWLFLVWTALVLGVYARQLLEQAAALGFKLGN
jgi:hypothetical protein